MRLPKCGASLRGLSHLSLRVIPMKYFILISFGACHNVRNPKFAKSPGLYLDFKKMSHHRFKECPQNFEPSCG